MNQPDFQTLFSRGCAVLVLTGACLQPSVASPQGRENTALGLGAAAVYEYVKGQHTNGLVLGAGAAYAAKKYEDERRQRSQQAHGGYYHRGASYRPDSNGPRIDRWHNDGTGGPPRSGDNDKDRDDRRHHDGDHHRHHGRGPDDQNWGPGRGNDHGNKRGWVHGEPYGQWKKHNREDGD